MVNEVFYLFIVPPILITVTILLSFLIGTPLRMIPKLYNWWYSQPYISMILFFVGIITCFLSMQFPQSHVINSEGKVEEGSNFEVLSIGWLTVSFSLIHFYYRSFIQFIRRKLNRN